MSRESFLERVQQAAVVGRTYRVATERLPEGFAYVGAADDLCQAVADEVQAVGGQATLVSNHQQAREAVEQLCRDAPCRSALCWRHPVLERVGVSALLESLEIAEHHYDSLAALPPDERQAALVQADVGITAVDLAVAETGSLLVFSRPRQERVASLLPPMHIALVEQAQIVPDLLDAFARLEVEFETGLPSNVAFITGPSKTGDIELQLTTGVHGPGTWHVVIIRSA